MSGTSAFLTTFPAKMPSLTDLIGGLHRRVQAQGQISGSSPKPALKERVLSVLDRLYNAPGFDWGWVGLAVLSAWYYVKERRWNNAHHNTNSSEQITQLKASHAHPSAIVKCRLERAKSVLQARDKKQTTLDILICRSYYRNGGSGIGRQYRRELHMIERLVKTLGLSAGCQGHEEIVARAMLLHEWIDYLTHKSSMKAKDEVRLNESRRELGLLRQAYPEQVAQAMWF